MTNKYKVNKYIFLNFSFYCNESDMYLTFDWLIDDSTAGYFLPLSQGCCGHASVIADG